MEYEKSCGAIVINDKDEILLIKHRVGHVSFPKGHMEEGETEEETAIREVKEETGIDITVDTNYRYITNYSPKKGVSKDVIYFLGHVVGGKIKPQYEEVSEAYFVPITEVLDCIDYDNMKELFKQFLKDIKKD